MDPRSDRGVSVLPGVELPPRYEPLRHIARGGMASVWCARDRTLDRHVAIKLLAGPYAHDELAGRRFTREARAAARLSGHANVVTIYDVGQASSSESPFERPFIVMEYLAGGTVADALRTGELDRPLILTWLRQAADAIDYAHRRGVIHRDVKLSNFLLDRERTLRVADFGIAQLGTEDTLTGSGHVLGTAAYLAPERALGLPATEASDRYALAVAAFELLVGGRPYTAEPFTVQARQHVEEPAPAASQRNPDLPPAIDAVLAQGMSKHQDERFATGAEMVDAIEHALGRPRRTAATKPVAAAGTVPALLPRDDRPGRARIAAAAALAAVLLGVALAAAATLVPAPRAHPAAARSAALRTPREQRRHPVTHVARDRPAQSNTSVRTATTVPAPTPASPAPGAGAAVLEAEGHQLMLGGQYASAIPVLRQAVAAAPRASLTYAYALYDLGRSLRLAGDPRAAVPILWQRLQIPNQTELVRGELGLALEALGQTQAGGGATSGALNGPARRHHPPSSSAPPPPAGPGGGGQGD